MASKRASKRSSADSELDPAEGPAVKRSRTSTIAPRRVSSAARSGARRSAGTPPDAPSGPPGEDEDAEEATAGLDFVSPEETIDRIQAILGRGAVDVFAQYVGPILDMPEEADGRNDSLASMSRLLETHGTDGSFWSEAWPIVVYAEHDQAEKSFDTLWLGAFPGLPLSGAEGDTAQMRWNWYTALSSLRFSSADKATIVKSASHYKEALRLAAKGQYPDPPLYRTGENHATYLTLIDQRMNIARVQESWLEAIERLRAAFGNVAAEELQTILDKQRFSSGTLVDPKQEERKIFWAHLHQRVLNPTCKHIRFHTRFMNMCMPCIRIRRPGRVDRKWFRAQYDYIQNCHICYGIYLSTENLEACVAFVQDRGSYEGMCIELSKHVTDLRNACMTDVAEKWTSRIEAEGTFFRRKVLFKRLHHMTIHFSAGGMPYTLSDLQRAADSKQPHRLSKAKASQDFKIVWNISEARAIDLGLVHEVEALICFPLSTSQGSDLDQRDYLQGMHLDLRSKGYFFLPFTPIPEILSPQDQAQTLLFGGQRSGIAGKWKYRGTLGTGSWGHAALWQKVDEKGEWMVDQLVIKEAYMPGDKFDQESYWVGSLYRRIVKEEKISRDLSALGNGSESIVKSRGYAIYETLRMVRIYMEYCPHGDLEETIERYLARGNKVPERQVWCIFEALIDALCLLKCGGLPGGTKRAGWKGILHRDLKPANVFLSSPSDQGSWEGIPRAKMGDFGLATEFDVDVSRRTGVGTERYAAPEQQKGAEQFEEQDGRRVAGISCASDLWAVGRVILTLMNLQLGKDVKACKFGVDQEVNEGILAFGAGVEGRYSEILRGLVRACLQVRVEHRPDVEEVWQVIRQNVNAVVGGKTMKSGGPSEGEVEIDVKRDEYAVKFARR